MVKSGSIFICLCSAFLLSCASDVETFDSTETLGTQLEDLHKAYTINAITEKEYKKAKEILIDHYQ